MKKLLCFVFVGLLPTAALPADAVTIPFGTTVFCELGQPITTRQREAHAVHNGDIVLAHVWKDVWVDGYKVIAAVFAKIDRMKPARLAGQKGYLEIEVFSVQAIDKREVPLGGGYDRSGKGRMGVTIGLAAGLAWPFVFIKGKNVFLEPGTIFDAVVRAPTEVEVQEPTMTSKTRVAGALEVKVPYGEIDPDKKIKQLPLILYIEEVSLSRASVVSVNGSGIHPIQISLIGGTEKEGFRATVDYKALSNHFQRGINRFDVEVGDHRTEVVLEIEY